MLTSSDRALLFGDSQHLIKITELIEYLRTILDDSEHKVYYAQRDLELQNHCIIRIRQLLKGAVRSKSGSPYSSQEEGQLHPAREGSGEVL